MVSREIPSVNKYGASNLQSLKRRILQRNQSAIRINQEPAEIVETNLAKIREAWNQYQSTNNRNAVYIYLTAIYNVVRKWRRIDLVDDYCALALHFHRDHIDMEPEPFAVLIYCTADPEKVDKKTRSKWSRALRVVEACKRDEQTVREFIKWYGGINECAALFPQIYPPAASFDHLVARCCPNSDNMDVDLGRSPVSIPRARIWRKY